jgi:hypothetical protein
VARFHKGVGRLSRGNPTEVQAIFMNGELEGGQGLDSPRMPKDKYSVAGTSGGSKLPPLIAASATPKTLSTFPHAFE